MLNCIQHNFMKYIYVSIFLAVFSCQLFAGDKFEFNHSDLNLSIKRIEVIGDELIIDMIATNKSDNTYFEIFFSRAMLIDEKGREIIFKGGYLGFQKADKSGTLRSMLIKNTPINCGFVFDLEGKKINKIKSLEIPGGLKKDFMDFQITFAKLPTDFILPNPYPNADDTVKFEKQSFNISNEVTLDLTGFSKTDSTIIFDYCIKNNDLMPYRTYFSFEYCRAIDPLGNESKLSTISLGDEVGRKNRNLFNEIPAKSVMNGKITLNKASDPIESIKLLELLVNKQVLYIQDIGLTR